MFAASELMASGNFKPLEEISDQEELSLSRIWLFACRGVTSDILPCDKGL